GDAPADRRYRDPRAHVVELTAWSGTLARRLRVPHRPGRAPTLARATAGRHHLAEGRTRPPVRAARRRAVHRSLGSARRIGGPHRPRARSDRCLRRPPRATGAGGRPAARRPAAARTSTPG